MHSPLMNGSTPFSPVWSGISDSSIRPTLICIKDAGGSGYRPASPSDFGGSATISGSVAVTGVVAVDAVGITGRNGLVLDIFTANSLGQLPVLATQSGTWNVSAQNGLGVNAAQSGNWNVGITGTVPTKAGLPISQNVYAINLTGNAVFSNYASVIPNVNGNPISLSVEPDSDNNFKVYYSFSGTATTGQAWELRGDKTFELSSTTGIFFAQASGGNRIMVHYQQY